MTLLMPKIDLDIGDVQATIITVDMPTVELGVVVDMPLVGIGVGVPGPDGPPGPQGPTILTGSGRPGPDDGEPGQIYLDVDTDTIYGPKLANPYGLPETVLTGLPANYFAGPLEAGTRFSSTVGGRVTGIQYYRAPGSTDTPVTVSMWDLAGYKLAMVTAAAGASGLQSIPLPTPVVIDAATSYRVSITIPPTGFYARTDSGPGTTPLVGDNVTLHSASYSTGLGANPSTDATPPNFWIEPVFEPIAPGLWPVALQSDSKQVTGFFRSGTMTIGPGDYRIYNLSGSPRELINVGIALRAPATGAFTCDVHLNETTIFTNQSKRPTITAGQNYAISGVPDVLLWPHGSYLTVDRDVVSGTPGIDLTGEIAWRVLIV